MKNKSCRRLHNLKPVKEEAGWGVADRIWQQFPKKIRLSAALFVL